MRIKVRPFDSLSLCEKAYLHVTPARLLSLQMAKELVMRSASVGTLGAIVVLDRRTQIAVR
jgi:hypothetical protein